MKTKRQILILGMILLGVNNCMPPGAAPTPCVGNCGSSSSSSSSGAPPLPPPASSEIINIAPYAYVTATTYAFVSDVFANPINVKDGLFGISSNDPEYSLSWITDSNVDQSTITLQWSTPAIIKSIDLYDLATASQITSGKIEFNPADGTTYIASKLFNALPNDGLSKGTVAGPGDIEVKSITISIFSHTGGNYAGLNEVVVNGYRVKEKSKLPAANANLGKYAKVTHASSVAHQRSTDNLAFLSSSNEPINSSSSSFINLASTFSPRHITDGKLNTFWVSVNGNSSEVEVVFDQPYCISEVTLNDVPADNFFTSSQAERIARFKSAELVFNDALIGAQGSKSDINNMKLTLPIDATKGKDVSKILIKLKDVNTSWSNNVGLTELDIKPCP